MRVLLSRVVAVAAALVAGAGCSSSTAQVQPQAPWDPNLAQFFDDAVDFIEDPGDLAGAWASGYAQEVQGRVDEADVIARVHVTTVNEDIAVDGHRRKHVLMNVTSLLYGDMPPDERLHLSVGEGVAGFDTVDRNERRLIDNRFVAFVRWYDDDDGTVRAHWHLSPGSRAVIETVRRQVTERQEASPDEPSLP